MGGLTKEVVLKNALKLVNLITLLLGGTSMIIGVLYMTSWAYRYEFLSIFSISKAAIIFFVTGFMLLALCLLGVIASQKKLMLLCNIFNWSSCYLYSSSSNGNKWLYIHNKS